jgi:hypothetical protein
MKARLAIIAALLSVCQTPAVTLRPSMIVYGVIRDSYGLRPGPDSAMVSAFFGTTEVARTPIKPQPAGGNYRFEVNVSDPLTASTNDVIPGATVSVRVRMGAALPATIGANTFIARGHGSTVQINLILGTDSDNDGLPDDWEWMVIANSGGAISNLTQVGPGMDLDGDGMPDDQEFLNGTFPFLPGDELRVGMLTVTEGGRLSFSFTSVNGALYSVESAATVESPEWAVTPVSLAENGAPELLEFTGDGRVVTIYFAGSGPTHFYRLRSR